MEHLKIKISRCCRKKILSTARKSTNKSEKGRPVGGVTTDVYICTGCGEHINANNWEIKEIV